MMQNINKSWLKIFQIQSSIRKSFVQQYVSVLRQRFWIYPYVKQDCYHGGYGGQYRGHQRRGAISREGLERLRRQRARAPSAAKG